MKYDREGQAMIRAAMKAPYLDRDEEHDLALRWRENRDQEALHRITVAHMRLVVSMAMKFRNYGLPLSDLIQEGHVGLLEAASRFDPARDVRFSTYATWWVRAAMQDFVLKNWSIVRGGTSSAQKSLFFNLRRLRARIARSGEALSDDAIYQEISAALGISVRDVANMDSRLSAPDTSLNAPVSDTDAPTAEHLEYLVSEEPLPDEATGERVDGERRYLWLSSALAELTDRELSIIKARRLSDEGATLEQLGTKLGISKERVRQIETRAMEKLRLALVSRDPEMARHAFW